MTTIELHVQADRELVERLCADFTDDKVIESVEIRSTTPSAEIFSTACRPDFGNWLVRVGLMGEVIFDTVVGTGNYDFLGFLRRPKKVRFSERCFVRALSTTF